MSKQCIMQCSGYAFSHIRMAYNLHLVQTIVTGSKINYNKYCRLEFGTYVQVHEQHNNSIPRTSGVLALHPTGNVQGSYFCYLIL